MVVSGPHVSLFSGTPKTLAREALALRGEAKARAVVKALAPQATVASLELVRTSHDRFGDGDEIVSFGQVYRGLPVVGFGATVRMDKDGDVVFSSVDLASRDLPVSTKPTLDKTEAVARVARAYRLSLAPSDAYLVVASTFEGAKLVYAVIPSLPLANGSMPRFMVDANDGTILEARDMRAFVSAQVRWIPWTESSKIRSFARSTASTANKRRTSRSPASTSRSTRATSSSSRSPTPRATSSMAQKTSPIRVPPRTSTPKSRCITTVSYTHLTLPTSDLV